jgi:competence protein ComFC
MKGLFEHDNCLVCHEVIESLFGWIDLLSSAKRAFLCESCLAKLQKIVGEVCKICGRPFATLNTQFRSGDGCYDCLRWEEDPEFSGLLSKNFSFYQYNEFLKEVIAKFKYRGDYVLAKIFAEEIKSKIKEIKPDYIMPIPLSEERLYERGFNQAEALIIETGFQPTNLLTRIHSEKQSKKSRLERIHLSQVFLATKPVNGKIIIIDDIYTTGSTLRYAAKALKTAGAKQIFSITIARG